MDQPVPDRPYWGYRARPRCGGGRLQKGKGPDAAWADPEGETPMRRGLDDNFTAVLFGGVQAGPGGGPAWAFWGQILRRRSAAGHGSRGPVRGLTPDRGMSRGLAPEHGGSERGVCAESVTSRPQDVSESGVLRDDDPRCARQRPADDDLLLIAAAQRPEGSVGSRRHDPRTLDDHLGPRPESLPIERARALDRDVLEGDVLGQ